MSCACVQSKGALAAAAAASAVAAQVARGRGRAALARGAFVSAAAPGYVTPGSERIDVKLFMSTFVGSTYQFLTLIVFLAPYFHF